MFQQPRRFPEYLRLQNIRDRVDDLSSVYPPRPVASGAGGEAAKDATLARIGEVRPVDHSEKASGSCRGAQACDPVPTTAVDGMGRMIDVIA